MPNHIRNFVIISHIDHGKSTLADRFLELTGTIEKGKMANQYLDSMDLEKEKGITIKMHPCRMLWRDSDTGNNYILNLIDTPGHIDFSYEISRALACVEGAILLVDATKGIQAQTLFNLEQAQKQGLEIIAAVNKIDAASEDQIEQSKKELATILNFPEEEIFSISGKQGVNIDTLIKGVVERIPSPKLNPLSGDIGFLGLIFDSKYDSFSGVIAYVRVFGGEIRKNREIFLAAQREKAEVKEVGYFLPFLKSAESLQIGEIGYIKTGIKDPMKVKVGDTVIGFHRNIIPDSGFKLLSEVLTGYKDPQPVLFLSLYPTIMDDFETLRDALWKLRLNDAALDFQPESQMALGRGFRVGFLGSLHAEITIRRLKSEFNLDLVATCPQVVFEVQTKKGENLIISSPSLWPDPSKIAKAKEPWVMVEIMTPNFYFNQVFKTLKRFKIELKEVKNITSQKSLLLSEAPLREIISGSFYDQLKSVSEGYASFSFRQIGYKESDLVKLEILVAGVKEEAFAKIIPQEDAFSEGKRMVQKLKNNLPAQQFVVSLQAVVSGKILARENIKALRKDVTAPLYGGDVTRKRKLLEIQKKGKKELREKGKINIPPHVFLEMLKD